MKKKINWKSIFSEFLIALSIIIIWVLAVIQYTKEWNPEPNTDSGFLFALWIGISIICWLIGLIIIYYS